MNSPPISPYHVDFRAGSSKESLSPSTPSPMYPKCNFRYNDSRTQMIIEVPMAQLKKFQKAEGTISVKRETQHFCETTTMHGPKRIFKGKRIFTKLFWLIMVLGSLGLLIYQCWILSASYLSKPIVSQVSFLIPEDGMEFPSVTVCNFTPIRKSYIEAMNRTGDVSPDMINYLMNWFTEIPILLGNTDQQSLNKGNEELREYQSIHPNFTVDQFFMDASFDCSDLMKLCSFQGESFDCCSLASPTLTPVGKCFTLDLSKSPMNKQTEPGIRAGLSLTLDANLDEQFDSSTGIDALLPNSFVNGFRYFVHPKDTIPNLASDEYTVSPNSVAYSAISKFRYVLLPPNDWGNCTEDYPYGIQSNLSYTSGNCLSLCKAKYFMNQCGCTPALYNIGNNFQECTPFETYNCVNNSLSLLNEETGKMEFQPPSCTRCGQQCDSQVYRADNSNGNQFSAGAFNYFNSKNSSWSVDYMKSNFQMIRIFYRDMSYTEYNQVQDASITDLLSAIGGNMGMFLGGSVITIVELFLFFSKVFWIGFSKTRRNYLYSKRANEKAHKKEVVETVEKMKVIASQGNLTSLSDATCATPPLKLSSPNKKVEFRINFEDLASQLDFDSSECKGKSEKSSNLQKY
ncbi:DEgenerin Linked to Mechanosensation [Caenorhabditis elegans]|uniref:DEgenerin Linked to Mechanosensation n=1 Tax=Caenorhabditis elegans TaxID=6239 RepID=O45402_CAEEL|nr:DEgenerin Linked to Mechanosensation [Caenorhabditis elegans]CAB05178.2 DEgenerin Linked to Mechanosensation [Caenorhabditis elegans]|eukprot:NP_501590.2 DEgenerin Linked to Mechanosensation [Caenorhabditis elegans]